MTKSTWINYVIGFLARPLGGILFGYYGDRFGRKNALSTSILLMSLSCFIIGVLPTYQQIGISAAILLSAARFLQGICVGNTVVPLCFLLNIVQVNKPEIFLEHC